MPRDVTLTAGVVILQAGVLLPESVLQSRWFASLAAFVAFVAINTVMYVTLAVAKIVPKVTPYDLFPRRYTRAETRSIYPDAPESGPDAHVTDGLGVIIPGMSTDGATDKPRPARPGRGDDRGLPGIALGALLILAVVATVVMVFSDNPVWMRIGTLASLWAAFIGAFLVARYRRQAASEAARVRDLHTVYELQLEREISARREHELVVEKELRESVRQENADALVSLREEIAALREQLSALGVTLPEDRHAVGGHTAAGELGAGSLPSVPSERVEPRRRAPLPTSGPIDTPVPGVGTDATPSTERTEKLSPVTDTGSWSAGRSGSTRRPAVRPAAASAPSPRPSEESTPGPASSPASTPAPAPAWSRSSAPAPTPEPRQSSATASATEQEPRRSRREPEPVPAGRHGQGAGMSVAELMARLGGGDAPQGGRRHRHADD